MRREIEDRVVVDHEDDRMPRRRGAALRAMRVHDGRAGDRPTVEQPGPRLGVGERAPLSRQALVGGPGDRRHNAHEPVGASGIPKISRPELGLGPMTGFIEHVRSLAGPPRAAKSARNMKSLAHKRKMWVTVRVRDGWIKPGHDAGAGTADRPAAAWRRVGLVWCVSNSGPHPE